MSDHDTCLHRKKGHDSKVIHNTALLAITCTSSMTSHQLVSPLGGCLNIKNEYTCTLPLNKCALKKTRHTFDQRPRKRLIIKMCLVWAILIQLGYALEQKNDPWGAILSITYKCFRWRGMTYLRHSRVRGGWTPFHQWQGFGLQVSVMEGRWCSPSRSVFVLGSPQAWM